MRKVEKNAKKIFKYHWFIKVIGENWESELIQNQRHEGSIAHMSRNLIRYVHVFQTRYVLYRPQTCHSAYAPIRRAEQIIQYPVSFSKCIYKAARHNRTSFTPSTLRSSESSTEDEDVLHDTKLLLLGELEKSVEDNTGPKRETNKGDRTYTKMALDQDVSEDAPSTFSTVEGVAPRVIN